MNHQFQHGSFSFPHYPLSFIKRSEHMVLLPDMAEVSYIRLNCDFNWTYLQMIQRSELIDLIKSGKIKCSTKQLETFLL